MNWRRFRRRFCKRLRKKRKKVVEFIENQLNGQLDMRRKEFQKIINT